MAFPFDLWTDDEEDELPMLLNEIEYEEIPELTEESDFEEEVENRNARGMDYTYPIRMWDVLSYVLPQVFLLAMFSIPRLFFDGIGFVPPDFFY